MTLEELQKMPIGTSKWDKDIELDIARVPGGWIYRGWDEVLGKFVGFAFVPEPSQLGWHTINVRGERQ